MSGQLGDDALGSDRMSAPAGELYTGGTFAGSPVGCAVGIKLIDVILVATHLA